jgi:hypothetical protein
MKFIHAPSTAFDAFDALQSSPVLAYALGILVLAFAAHKLGELF